MKIGILTYHDTFNAGAFLQAYATYKYLSELGLDVEVIDYVPKTGFIKEYKTKIITKQPFKGIKSILSQRKFLHDNLKLSSRRIISDDFKKSLAILKGYDLIVVGSDTVFEIRPRNKAFSAQIPNIYYLPQSLKCKKVSFAASADKSDFSLLDQKQSEYIRNSLNDFDHISVRDQFTNEFVKKLSNKKSDLVFDPTFLIDFPSTNIHEITKNLGDFAILNVANKEFGRIIRDEFHKRGWKVVCPTKCYLSDMNLNGVINPLQWAELYTQSKFTVTDRFHGTIFSLKGGCPVLSVDDAIEYKNQISKKEDMLKRLSLSSLLIKYDNVNNINSNRASILIDKTINSWDFEEIKSKLEMAKKTSQQFLNKVIND